MTVHDPPSVLLSTTRYLNVMLKHKHLTVATPEGFEEINQTHREQH